MAVTLSGVLTGPINNLPLPGVTIKLVALENSRSVIKTTQASVETQADGRYSMSVPAGLYEVRLEHYGVRPEVPGIIRVYDDSEPGTLNDFLNAPKTAPSPDWFVLIREEREKAEAAAMMAMEAEEETIRQTGIATEKAQIATQQQEEATRQAGIATEKAQVASQKQEEATRQAGIATEKATSAGASATAAEQSATRSGEFTASAQRAEQGATAQANRATTEADRAEAAASSVDEMLYAMSVAEFEARREANKRKYAGSGFVEWGKHYDSSIVPSVNQGITCAANLPNRIAMGRSTSAIEGVSRTEFPLVVVDGVEISIFGYKDYDLNRIELPPAPDGTKTYDSATGEVMDFTKDVDPKYGDVAADRNEAVARAFEGMVVNPASNGEYRLRTNASAVEISKDRDRLTWDSPSQSAAGAVFNVNVKSGVTYVLEGVVGCTLGDHVEPYAIIDTNAFESERLVPMLGGVRLSANEDTPFRLTLKCKASKLVTTELFYNTSNNVRWVKNLSFRPITNHVITSRKDFVLLEAWDEVVHGDRDSKGVIYPLGNVQYGLSTYEGIPLQNNNVAQGYSAVGEWDTETKGYSVQLLDLTFAQLCKFLQDPKNNLRYDAETRKLIQTRYRFRVVEGLGDKWISVRPTDGSKYGAAYSYKDLWVSARGKLDIVKDFTPEFKGNPYWSSVGVNAKYLTINERGIFQARNAEQISYNRNCFAVPIALIQRMNQGAYHPVYNPMGTHRFAANSVNSRVVWSSSQRNDIATVRDCFPMAISEARAKGYECWSGFPDSSTWLYGGDIHGGLSGRPTSDPYQFHDAIYAGQVEDLRLSAHKQDFNRLREDAVRRAVAGTLRGKGIVPFTTVFCSNINTLPSQTVGFIPVPRSQLTGDQSWITSRSISSPNIAQGYVVIEGKAYKITGVSFAGVSDENIGLHTDYPNIPTGFSGVYAALGYWLTSEFDILPWTDIIGHPERIAATFPNGVLGQWVPVLPEGKTKTFTFNRKYLPSVSPRRVYTEDNGVTFIEGGFSLNPVTSSYDTNLQATHVGLYQFPSFSGVTEAANNSKVLSDVGNVLGLMRDEVNRGNRLHASLTGNIGKHNGSNPSTVTSRVNTYDLNVHLPTYTLSTSDLPEHHALNLASPLNGSSAVKALYTLTEKNGLLYMQFHGRELKHDGTDWGDDNTIPIINGEGTMTDDNGQVVKTFCHHTLFPLGIASYTDSAMATE